MPFALGGIELGGLALAFFAFLLCVGVSYMLVAIGKAIEATSIPVVSSGLASIWRTITNPVVNLLVAATNALWSDVEWWGRGIAWLATTLFADIKADLLWDAGQIDHLFNSVIPNAAKTVAGDSARFVGQEIATLHRDIAEATTAIERAATGDAARALAKAEGFAGTIKASLTKLVAHDLTAAEKFADGALADAKTYTDTAINAIPVPSLAALGGVAAGAFAALEARVIAVEAVASEFESCGVTSCAGPNQLSNLLPALLGLVGYGSIIAFIEQAIRDPHGTEAQYAGQLISLVSGAVSGGADIASELESLIGL